jgi:hypothetical protein
VVVGGGQRGDGLDRDPFEFGMVETGDECFENASQAW